MKRLDIHYNNSGSSSCNTLLERGYNHYLKNYGSDLKSGKIHKYLGKRIITSLNTTVVKATEQRRNIADTNIVILLGGTFEKIGESDESIGGGNQKVG